MKKIMAIFATMFITAVILSSCSNYGKEKNFKGVQLFYTSTITETEADLLGNYLIKSGFANGEVTVQINKNGNKYEFRMVVKKGMEQDQEYIDVGKLYAAELSSNVFNGEQVDIHLCDENLKTLRVLPMDKNKNFYGVKLFYTSTITETEADLLGNYLIKSEFANGEAKTVQINKNGNTYEFKMFFEKGIEQDQEYIEICKLFAAEISSNVFNGEQVNIHFCDKNLNTLKVLPMDK